MDHVVQAMSCVINASGFPGGQPVNSTAALCDYFANVHLCEHEKTAKTNLFMVSGQDAIYRSLASNCGMQHSYVI